MILRTTRCRLKRMGDAITHGDISSYGSLGLALTRELRFVEGGDKDRSVCEGDIHYSAGVAIRELMIQACYTGRDTMRRGLSSSHLGALQDITKATNEEARHPALRGEGLLGHHARIFPSWYKGNNEWSPFPIKDAPFELLCPAWHADERYPTERFTLWSPTDGYAPTDYRLQDPATHWSFLTA